MSPAAGSRSIRHGGWEPYAVGLAVLVFICVSVWWLMHDNRIPDWDSGIHMNAAFVYHQWFAQGNIRWPLAQYNGYAPLVYVLGALAIFVTGMHPMALILSANVVFVPLMAFGCYGVGNIVAGRTAGLLAALFALGSPMVVSMMHEYLLDAPEAAMVAVAVWAILASRRFERPGVSLAAGLVCGLALMTKQTAVVFLAGPFVVVLAREGWKNWRGLVLFAAACGLVAGPWYLIHFHDVFGSYRSTAQLVTNRVQAPPLLSFANVEWYFWDLVNQQVLTPFAALFLIGLLIAIVRAVRRPETRSGYLPELLAGTAVSYVVMTYLTHKDPRYTLPALVYVAVISTFWIPECAAPLRRRALTATVVALAIVYLAGVSFGIGGVARRVMISLPGAQTSIIWPGHLTAFEDSGWLRGGPERNGNVLALLRRLRAQGVRWVAFSPSTNYVDFSPSGLLPLLDEEGIRYSPQPLDRFSARYLVAAPLARGSELPCQAMTGSTGGLEQNPGFPMGIYVFKPARDGRLGQKTLQIRVERHLFALSCPPA